MDITYSEFRKKIHKPFYEHFLTEFLFRPISNRIVYFLIKKMPAVTANMVTGSSLILVLIFSVFFILGTTNNLYLFFASFLFIFFHLLDVIDGDLARARNIYFKEKTNNGALFDALIHQYYNSGFFITAGYAFSIIFSNIYLFYFGIFVAVILAINNILLLYIESIKTEEEEEKYLKGQFKNLTSLDNVGIKQIISSFMGIMGFALLFFIGAIFDFVFGIDFFKLILFLVFGFAGLLVHLKTFIHFLKLK